MARPLFRDRRDAGRTLARVLSAYRDRPDVIVLALPRGGVPVAYEVALALHAPLDVFIVRKLGVPGHEEYAMGAVASGGVRVMNDKIVQLLGISDAAVDDVARAAQRELERRERRFREGRPPLDVTGRTVVLVDDGLATGATMLAAVKALQAMKPERLVIAVPTAATETCEDMRREADEVICATTPEPFRAVGLWYENFEQTSDEEVHDLLAQAEHDAAHHA
jgi:predicted phosphoribosyltransferase